ncbi:MAG TPA: bifunctional hydroxymethylpyrimidine kinase/phosphomethylpyrimidine kinase, partial [Anaerolineae bacterium]|nr:bifunctional hydroxymethylpyrimidine kinase/phosphomethylpyrimidine kinase [Anaerolineae bacterium]
SCCVPSSPHSSSPHPSPFTLSSCHPVTPSPPLKLLTIAGSDSGGAAGLQADLRAWAALGAYGLCAITAVTAQNSLSVQATQMMPPEFVAQQMATVLSDYGADGAKTGFIGQTDAAEQIAAQLRAYNVPQVVIDPVLVNHKGEAMFGPELTAVYQNTLFPLATLITPNRREAELLTGLQVETRAEAELAAVRLYGFGPQAVLLKSIPHDDQLVDILYDGRTLHHFSQTKIETANTHGSGDTLSAAVCFFLADGEDVVTAVSHAQQFTRQAIQHAAAWQMGAGHGPVFSI